MIQKIKIMKTITLILTLPILLFSLSQCGSAQNTNNKKSFVQNPPFKISEAYYQNWAAGVEQAGTGANVHVNFSEIDPDVVIQNIFFKNRILEAKGNVNEPMKFVGYLKNEDRTDVIMDSDPIKEAQNTPSKIFPFELGTNDAVVEYWFDGQKNYYKIPNLSQKDMIPYPQAKPRE